MSQNQKLINIFTKFFDEHVGNESYKSQKFKLKGNYPTSVLVEATTGGSEGGDCWGGHTSEFSKDSETIKDDIKSDISYQFRDIVNALNIDEVKFSDLCEEYAEKVKHYSISDCSEGGDYYGNYTKYELYEIDAVAFLKELMDHKSFEVFQGFAENFKNISNRVHLAETLNQEEKLLVTKLEGFAKSKLEEKHQLEKRYQDAKKQVINIEQQLAAFDKSSIKEKEKLQAQLDKVQAQKNPVDQPVNSSKKYKIK